MPQRYQYLFKIDAFTPETIPMARLAQYMDGLAAMIGHQSQVHFVKVDPGSMTLVSEIEYEAEPKVRERIRQVRSKEGPDVARNAYKAIDEKLREDNASAELIPPEGGHVLKFPGRKQWERVTYGPFNQEGTLDGVLIRIGGQGDSVPVHLLEESDTIHVCEARRDVAIQLGPFYLRGPIRVSGTGRWFRDEDAHWKMNSFRIADFTQIKDEKLSEALDRIRSIKGLFSDIDDPIAELEKIRNG